MIKSSRYFQQQKEMMVLCEKMWEAHKVFFLGRFLARKKAVKIMKIMQRTISQKKGETTS